MAKAKKLPSGNWRVQAKATIDGKQVVRSFTAPTAGAAELAAKEWQVKNKTIAVDSSNLTVGDAIDKYIEIKSNILSPSTIRSYKKIKNNQLKDIENLRLNQLTNTVIQKHINGLCARYAPKSVLCANGLITVILNQFAPDINIGKISLPQKKKIQSRSLSKDEISKLFDYIQGHELEVPILLALWLGLRRSEILALTWDDVGFKSGTIRINKALVEDENNNLVEKPPKTTDSERILKLPNYIAIKLKSLNRSVNRIFNMPLNKLTKEFPKICENAGIPRYRFHDLRHSMATLGVTLNIADKVMMARGGWNNINTMKNIYQTVLSDDYNEADKMINDYFESIIKSHEKSHE